MKTLIAYASKTQTAKRCAERLNELIEGSELFDLEKNFPDASGYDSVIIGCGIRMGRFHKLARKFISDNKDKLRDVKLGVFICNGFPDYKEYFTNDFRNGELEGAITASFGGELDVERLRGTDKLIAKMVLKSGKELPVLDDRAIEEFAEKFA